MFHFTKTSPLDVFMTAEEADKLEGNIRLELIYSPTGQLTVTALLYTKRRQQETTKIFRRTTCHSTTPGRCHHHFAQ